MKVLNEYHVLKNRRWHSLVLCDCGQEFTTEASHIRTGHTKSCGCSRVNWMKNDGQKYNKAKKLSPEQRIEYAKKKIYKSYIQKCRKQDIGFDLSFDEFISYLSEDCVYCGFSNSNEYYGFHYNGIDRKDSKKGYTKDNICSCCGPCNYSKLDYSPKEYIQKCKDVTRHQEILEMNHYYKEKEDASNRQS